MRQSVKMGIRALRSNKYKQGEGSLYNVVTREYCCLGVACDLYNKTHKKKVNLIEGENTALSGDKSVVRRWLGLISTNGEFIFRNSLKSLADENDGGASFKQIAKIIVKTKALFKKELNVVK